jgi:glyoxylase-like metal-dependent hydrolase (beta-lactamase superfamily II)
MPVLEAGLVEFIDPDFRLTDEVSLIPTPGHTPGHVSVLIQSQGQSAVITGDLMHNPIQIAVPGDEGRFDMDKAAAAQTRRTFVERFNNTSTLVIGSHFADPSAGHIVPDGKAWKLKV